MSHERMRNSKHVIETISSVPTLSVLGYQEEDEWVALALEMDLRGYGATFQQAAAELRELVGAQVSFARLKGQPGLVWKPAEPVYWRLFEDARRDRFEETVLNRAPRNPSYEVGAFPLPASQLIAERVGKFEQSQLRDLREDPSGA